MSREIVHNFDESLRKSHEAEDLPFWREAYQKAFPDMQEMINHRRDGDHQRQGIDRSIVLWNSKQILVDEKVRWRNKKTGEVYGDIALEVWSDRDRKVRGWVCKALLCDYIAYAIAPLGVCYLLPVPQLQKAFRDNKHAWKKAKYPVIDAPNEYQGRTWFTRSVCIPPRVLFQALNDCMTVRFVPVEETN